MPKAELILEKSGPKKDTYKIVWDRGLYMRPDLMFFTAPHGTKLTLSQDETWTQSSPTE